MAGPEYADRTRAAYVLHMLDEFIHHGAEIALLRDLWRWQNTTVAEDPLVERVIRGDASVLDDLGDVGPRRRARRPCGPLRPLGPRGRPRANAAHPFRTTGRTPLHIAAGAGELAVVKTLLDHGADPAATDPEFHATPLQWAEFLHHQDVVDLLANRADDTQP